MNIEFTYPKYYDLLFHVMAYFKVNNASDLYDENYIIKMKAEKAKFDYDIIPVVNLMQKYYNDNFERLMLINFLPYYCNSYDEMKNIFLTCNRFTQDDIQIFVIPFIEMLDNEAEFFFNYWEKVNKNYQVFKNSIELNFKNELKKYTCIFDYFKKPCKILFSYNITRNGRGFYSDSHFAALIRFPENEAVFNFSFIQLLHEYTHIFTDGLLNLNINMKDGSHNLSEYIVLLADYYLIKSLDEKFIPKYFEWIKYIINEDLDESKFLSIFNIDENLRTELIKLIGVFQNKAILADKEKRRKRAYQPLGCQNA